MNNNDDLINNILGLADLSVDESCLHAGNSLFCQDA